jgi:hypothetical protein
MRSVVAALLLGVHSDAYQLAARPLSLVRTPLAVRPAALLPSMCDAAAVPLAAEPTGFRSRVKKLFSFDKDKLKRSGVDAVFTYGVVSNINVGFTVALAWCTFSKSSGLSPLVPGQWKPFLATYLAIYATLGTLLRPVRLAIAVGATPIYSNFVLRVRALLPFASSRPALNRSLALFLVSGVLNVCGTSGIILFGAWIAGVVSGVPAFPPGWQSPF